MLPPRRLRTPACLLLLLCLAVAVLGWPAGAAFGAPEATRTLLPIGSGYGTATLQRFARAAAERDTTGQVELLVLPITFGVSAFETTPSERRKNLDLADRRRGQLETACQDVISRAQSCRATLVPMLVRDDAFLQSNLSLFTDDVDGIYILGGDQTVAMQVVANTPTEQRMAQLYAAGAVVGGNSAGAAVTSRTMIAGYIGNNGPENGFEQGAVEIWAPEGSEDRTRGVSFGLSDAVLDQHVLQRGRIARLIATAFSTGLLGVGADADTGAAIVDETTLTDISGRSAAFVVDLQGASGGFDETTGNLSLRNAVTHLIPGGAFGYNLATRQPLVGGAPVAAPTVDGRSFEALRAPAGAGPLLLGGGLAGDLGGPAAQQFVALSGGAGARIVVLTAGYARATDGRAAARAHATALQALVGPEVKWYALDDRPDIRGALRAIEGATGIWLTAPDATRVTDALAAAEPVFDAARARWQGGATLLADGAAAAAAGERYAVSAPSPTTTAALEEAAILSFRPDSVPTQPGLRLLPGVVVEAGLVLERRWGQLYNLLAADHASVGLGVDAGTAVIVGPAGATVVGESVAVLLDGRSGEFATGTNGALGARYVLLDSYVSGEAIR